MRVVFLSGIHTGVREICGLEERDLAPGNLRKWHALESAVLSCKLFLAAATVCLLSMPASAAIVTDVFTGVVAPASAGTTTDNSPNACGGPCFGGGSLTLTLTMSVPTGMTSGQIQGGSDPAYGGTNPLTMMVTINGVPLTLSSFFPNYRH